MPLTPKQLGMLPDRLKPKKPKPKTDLTTKKVIKGFNKQEAKSNRR